MEQNTPEVESTAADPEGELPRKLEGDFAPLADPESAGATPDAPDAHHRVSHDAQLAFEAAAAAAAVGDEDLAVQEYLKASNLAEAAREWYMAAVACQRVGDFLLNDKPPTDLERAFRMYRRAVAAYEHCGLFEEARRLSYRLMRLKLSRAGELRLSLLLRLELFLFWAVTGFGFRPLRVLGFSLASIVAYGLVFRITDGVVTPGETPRTAGFWECLYFSGITFSTVGYGDFVPAPHMRFVALTEGALGVFCIGFFVVILANRLRH